MIDEIYKIVYIAVYVIIILWFLCSTVIMTIKYKREMREMDLKFKRKMKYMKIKHKAEMKIIETKRKALDKKFKDLLT